MSTVEENLLAEIADIHGIPEGAYNIRANGKLNSRNTTANIDIVTKTDEPGIDIIIKDGTKNESVHIPVIISQTGLTDLVYNDFYVGNDCDVTIVAGCGSATAEIRIPSTMAFIHFTLENVRKCIISRNTTEKGTETENVS